MKLFELKETLPSVKTLSVKELAELHGVSEKTIEAQLKKGMSVEMEHTDKKSLSKEIALDHIKEDPKYYDKLIKMEEGFGRTHSMGSGSGAGDSARQGNGGNYQDDEYLLAFHKKKLEELLAKPNPFRSHVAYEEKWIRKLKRRMGIK